ncbi:MAG TPA: hypothetical protein VIE87_15000, partial [Pseudolabrys sp.]
RGLAVVDMRDDGEVADILERDRRHARQITLGVGSYKPDSLPFVPAQAGIQSMLAGSCLML